MQVKGQVGEKKKTERSAESLLSNLLCLPKTRYNTLKDWSRKEHNVYCVYNKYIQKRKTHITLKWANAVSKNWLEILIKSINIFTNSPSWLGNLRYNQTVESLLQCMMPSLTNTAVSPHRLHIVYVTVTQTQSTKHSLFFCPQHKQICTKLWQWVAM